MSATSRPKPNAPSDDGEADCMNELGVRPLLVTQRRT
jgi:hypothetical protein